MDGIFISYRRDDSAGYAGRLYDRLIPRFGAERVFMDVEGIELGADFVTAIEQAVGSCRVLVVIIGDEWLSTQDAAGRRRLDDPHDFIRLETVTALQRGIRVVPVLVGGALMPRAEDLPEDLRPLARRQAIEISHKQWEATTDELMQALEGMLGTVAATRPAVQGLAASLVAAPAPRPGRAIAVGAAAVALVVGAGAWSLMRSGDGTTPPATDTNGGWLTAQTATPAPSPSPAAEPAPAAAAAFEVPPPAVVVAAAPAPPAEIVAAAPPPAPAAAAAAPARAAVVRPPANPPQRTERPDPPAQVARVAPEAVRRTDPKLPSVGESWTYRTRGKWPNSPARQIVIAVQAVDSGGVTEGLRAEGLPADVQRAAGALPAFTGWRGIGTEFSPYLAAYSDLATLGTLRGFSTPDVAPNWSQWYSEARVIGQETVTVPAGSFQAHKVEVWSSRSATGGATQAAIEPVRIHYLVWYAAPAKRYVKMQRRVLSASGAENERDLFELVAHR